MESVFIVQTWAAFAGRYNQMQAVGPFWNKAVRAAKEEISREF